MMSSLEPIAQGSEVPTADLPPLIAAALRLEKSLAYSSGKHSDLYYSNPAKVVRRWLSTSSGAASGASAGEITQAALSLLGEAESLDPLLLEKVAEEDTAMKVEEPVKEEDTTDADAMKTDEDKEGEEKEEEEKTPSVPMTKVDFMEHAQTEVYVWLISLKVRLLWRQEEDQSTTKKMQQLCQKGITMIQAQLQKDDIDTKSDSLFPLLARLWRWLVLVAPAGTLRVEMARAHNMALLKRDTDTAATLLNCMLRDLLLNSQVEQAQKLLANSTFPTDTASNNQLCRFLYYSGRIQALRLEYTSSFGNLSQSLRKAPTNTALGFRIAVQRLLVVVQLLMGEIPDRQVFFTKGMKHELLPYLEITQAVRRGDLAVFTKVVSTHKHRLQKDETYTLISRLAHQVVKAGLRKLQLSYSRLSLQDVAQRLGLASAQQAELVVAKAVRDGVLDATIHHKEGYIQSHDLTNVYATKEPAEAFHRRIAYCLTTHNDAVRAMRYPPDAYKRALEASRGNRRRRQDDDKTDEEKAQELEDELEEDY